MAVGAAIAVVPLALAMALNWGVGYVYQSGDQAIIEISTRAAARFQQVLGPYDRFGWHHPGPAYFYLLSIPYDLLGSGGRAEIVGEVGISALAALLVVVAVARRTRGQCWLWAGLCMALLCAAVGFYNLSYVWNPMAVIVPTVLVVVLGALALGGSGLALVGVAVCGTFCVQTEVGTAPLVAIVALLGTAGVLLARFRPDLMKRILRRSDGGDTGMRAPMGRLSRRLWAAVGIATFVGLWVGPVIQQISGPGPGNLGEIVAFFRAPHPHLSLHTALNAMGAVDAMLALGQRTVFKPGLPTPVAGLWLVGAIALGFAAVGIGWWRHQRLAFTLGLMSLAGTVVSLFAFTRIVGGLYGYLVAWAVALPIAALLGVGLGLLAPALQPAQSAVSGDEAQLSWWRSGAARRLATGLLLIGGLALMAHSTDTVVNLGPGSNGESDAEVATAWRAMATQLRPTDHTVLVDIADEDSEGFSVGAGLVDRLNGLNIRATVPASWATQFGLGAVSHGHQSLTAVLDPLVPPSEAPTPGAVDLRSAGLRIYFLRPGPARPEVPKRHLRRLDPRPLDRHVKLLAFEAGRTPVEAG